MLELILSMVNLTTALVFVLILLVTVYVINMPTMLNMPPGPTPLPVIGSFLELRKDPGGEDFTIFQALARKYGKLCSLKLGHVHSIIVSDYSLMAEAFVKKADVFSDRPIHTFYGLKFINDKLGAGIVLNNGDSWKQLRRTSLMAMRDLGMGKQSLEETIQEEIRVLLDCIGQEKGQPFNAKPLFTLATSNIISGIIFGSRFEYDDARYKHLLYNLAQSFNVNPILNSINFFPYLKYLPPMRKSMYAFYKTLKTTTDYVKELIQTNEGPFDPDNIRNFIDLFFKVKQEEKEHPAFDERNLRTMIVDLFTAGSDTTATALMWAVLYMAQYPDVQAKCQAQIDEVVGKGKPVSLSDKNKLPYVEATILEVLRLRPVAPLGIIHSTNQKTELGGYHVPKDTVVFANIATINRDPETFPDPDIFMPGHFLDDNGGVIHRDRMVAFSIGSRSCVGEILAKMELMLFFTSFLQFYTITPQEGATINLKPYVSLFLLTTQQNVVFTKRD